MFDLLVTLLGMLVALPVMGGIAVLILVKEGRPVFFRQARPGLHGRIFTIYKFRTMRETLGADGQPLPDSQRISRLGRILRASSLDELPELFNVLRGEMSLVGPRPLLAVYLDRYDSEQARRHDVLPGITGWAQIHGRNAISWEEKFALDIWYVDHWSLWLDIKILAQTVWTVLKREGISQPGHATMDEFKGGQEN